MQPDAQTHQALSLLQQAFDALDAVSDSDIDTFEDEIEEAQAVPYQYACRKIIEAMGLLRGAAPVAPAESELTRFRIDMDGTMEWCEDGPWVRYEDVEAMLGSMSERIENLELQRGQLRAALVKIDAIRNDVVGRQSINWSRHIYPLVTALGEAGFDGESYEVAREKALAAVQGLT